MCVCATGLDAHAIIEVGRETKGFCDFGIVSCLRQVVFGALPCIFYFYIQEGEWNRTATRLQAGPLTVTHLGRGPGVLANSVR